MDFNGDGAADIVWRHDIGQVSIWTANGSGFDSGAYFYGAIGADWQIAGIGDFNGDGLDDLVWRHASGVTNQWFGTGSGFRIDANLDGSVGNDWKIVGVADFDGDGKDDLIWRHSERRLQRMAVARRRYVRSRRLVRCERRARLADRGHGRLQRRRQGRSPVPPRERHLQRVAVERRRFCQERLCRWLGRAELDGGQLGDFNGDGKADILFRRLRRALGWTSTGNGFNPGALYEGTVGNQWSVLTTDYPAI